MPLIPLTAPPSPEDPTESHMDVLLGGYMVVVLVVEASFTHITHYLGSTSFAHINFIKYAGKYSNDLVETGTTLMQDVYSHQADRTSSHYDHCDKSYLGSVPGPGVAASSALRKVILMGSIQSFVTWCVPSSRSSFSLADSVYWGSESHIWLRSPI